MIRDRTVPYSEALQSLDSVVAIFEAMSQGRRQLDDLPVDTKLSLVLIGKRKTRAKGGCLPYRKYIQQKLTEGVDVFVLAARGNPNVLLATQVAEEVGAHGLLSEVRRFNGHSNDPESKREIVIWLKRNLSVSQG